MDRRTLLPAAVFAAAITIMTAGNAFAAGWQQNEAGKWYYIDETGEPLKASVSPDGYLTDLFGFWEETPYDSLVGTYVPVSDTLDGQEISGEDVPGLVRTLSVKLRADRHIDVTETWAYPNGSVVRKSTTEYFPNTGGTYNAFWYPERRGNDLRWHDTGSYSNTAALTDDGNGQITMTADQDGKKRITVYQKTR
ncbi:MAG: hypothetical protein IJT43_09795 [Stomatobaculum sp.]|nr:hypothetical protein [Stomatobaculum sp.]